ncbi:MULTISPECIES: CsgG/HfaB family protein [unclassified Hahella]|uniref:CsgG/HfaB family protein n=1 Tax=unclassified Hahella TaxID=2624107 RepID=UPI000FDECC4C|nr:MULTISPECIES: CsgG/HfaB family protein [unclassified Hahella]AZZ92376.1 curli production assembly protein CsgG [Hahella sp. KA22]MBU6951403.1 CsgG/HfaB family protein [Hahella sp. HN01]MDG9672189.1 CsgG/HfaB family protein [Hahella sp. CR1]QAY55749.1 curli production assembly protein CsgG [Hahella sp. KA22]
MKALKNAALVALTIMVSACATESHRAIEPQKVASYGTSYNGERTTMVVGNFQNRSNYMQGLFSSDTDRLGNQAKSILKTHMQQTQRFNLVDRDNMQELQQEAQIAGVKQKIAGARYVISGSVTEFGRKEVGDRQLFGLLGRGKQQVAYAKVALSVVDVETSAIIYSTQGAGEYELSNREIIGFGGTAGYDATLNGKVLNFAITEVVNNLVRDLDSGSLRLK